MRRSLFFADLEHGLRREALRRPKPVADNKRRSAQPQAAPAGARTRHRWRSRFWDIVASRSQPGRPHGLLTGWWLWEQLACRLWPAFLAPGQTYGLVKIRVKTYRGDTVKLPDGSEIASGARIGEIHCNNEQALALAQEGINLFVAARDDLRGVARWIAGARGDIQALYGFTILGAAAGRIGFYRRPRRLTRRAAADRLYMNGLLAMYTPEGISRLRHGRILSAPPEEVWMSRRQLLRLYGEETSRPGDSGIGLTSGAEKSL